jgi:Tol biopolymer transport system component
MLVDFGLSKVGALSWSPDGTELAVSAQGAPFEAFEIHLINVDSATVKPLTHPPRYHFGDVMPVFSPGGHRLALVRGVTDDLQDIFVFTFGQEGLRQVTSDSVRIAGISWMPTGDAIVFSSQRRDPGGLWSISLDGQPPRLLASSVPGRQYENPTVASDGKRLAYSDRSSNLNIWRAFKPAGFQSLRSRPAVFSTYADSHPDISPDGERLVFRSNQSGHDEIWLADADGTNQSKLTAMSGSATAPKWSPDGTTIAFQGRAEGQSDIFLIDAQGGAPRRLTRSPDEDTLPQWSRDGSSVYFSSNRSGRWELWRISLDGEEPYQVTLSGGRFGMESHDGSELFFVKPDTLGIWKTALDALGEPELVFDELDASDWANWTVRESGIYFVRRLSYAPALTFRFFDSGREIKLVTLDNIPDQPALTAASDFSWFAFTQIDDEGGDLMILEGFE